MDSNKPNRFNTEPTISTQKKLMACKYCGHLNPRTARDCSFCGARFSFADYAESYAKPLLQKFGLFVILLVPVAVVVLAAFSFIAGSLGYGNVARSVLTKIYIGIGVVGVVMLGLGVLILTHRGKKNK